MSRVCLFLFIYYYFWLRHVASLTRDQTRALCSGSAESQPLNHQGIPRVLFLFAIVLWLTGEFFT